jgi:hypothetical protein
VTLARSCHPTSSCRSAGSAGTAARSPLTLKHWIRAFASSEGWPSLSEKDRRLWLPAVIYEQFGEHWVGFLQSGTRIPNENWEEIFEALEKLGIRSEYDWRIEVLFSQDS